jgi:hypothetical protein
MDNSQNYLTDKIVEYTARIIPYLFYIFFIIILLSVLLCIYFNQFDLAIRGLIFGYPTILASVLLVFIIKYRHNDFEDIILFPFKQKFLILISILLLLISIIVLFADIKLQFIFPLIIVSVYTLISIQIFTKKFSPAIILIEIISTQIIFMGNIFLNNSYYFGGTDIILHEFMAHVTFVSGNIIPPDLDSTYSTFPLYHIFVTIVSNISNIPLRIGIYFIAVPVSIISTLFIFFIFKPIIQNEQVLLFCSVIYSITLIDSSYDIYSYTLPRGLGFAGFLLLLYLFYTLKPHLDITREKSILLIIFSIFMVFTVLVHQVTILLIIFLLCLICLIELIRRFEKYISYSLLLIIIVFSTFYWFFISFLFTTMLIRTRVYSNGLDAPTFIARTISFSVSNFFLNNLTSQILLFFTIIGIGYIFVKKSSGYLWVVAAFSIVALLVYLPTPLSSIYQISIIFGAGRFPLLIRPFIAVIMGFGIIFFTYFLINKHFSSRVISILLVSIIILYGLSSTGLFKSDSGTGRQSFDFDEVSALNFGYEYIPYGSTISTDYYYFRYFYVMLFSLTEKFSLPHYNSNIISNLSVLSTENGYIIFPHKVFLNKGLSLGNDNDLPSIHSNDAFPTKENVILVNNFINSNNKIYSDSAVDILIRSERNTNNTQINPL